MKALLIIILIFLFSGCAVKKQSPDYYKRRNLMILSNSEMESNKKLYSRHNERTKAKALKQHKRNVREFNRSRMRR